jgi:hypothetical protein
MLTTLRSKAYGFLRSTAGQQFKVVKIARMAANVVNDLAGRPLAPAEELAERAAYDGRVAERHGQAAKIRAERAAERTQAKPAAAATPEAAPVVVYTDAQSSRDLKRIAEVMRGRDIQWIERSIVEDEATKSWVETTAKTKEFPVVFIAGEAIGGLTELVALDTAGLLEKKVYARN